MSVLKLNEN